MTGPHTLPRALRRAATTYAGHPAVVDGGTRLTWGELLEEVRATARGYAALGLRPGDRVAIWAPNGWEWVVAGLAVSYAGATLVPLNTRYKGAEVADVVERTGAVLLVVADGFLGRRQLDELSEAAGELARASELGAESDVIEGLPSVRAVVRIGEGSSPGTTPFADLASVGASVDPAAIEAVADAVSPDDVADILFTSGTTGRSKGVVTAHRQTISAAQVWGSTGELSADDRYLVISPFFHTYGYKVGIVACVLTGATLYPMATFDTDAVLSLIAEERISVVPGATAIFHSLLESPAFHETDTSSLRLANTGASVVPVALVERMQNELGFDLVLTAFGMTECVMGTMCRPGDPDDVVANTCGRAVEGHEVRIVDPATGEVRGPGEEGELHLRGPMVMLGYLDDPEATAEAIDADGWLHTGDVGVVDEAGYLRITDRLKDMYISGGFNVYPAEVEQALARLEGVVESAVVGVPDARMGEVGKAFVVRREGADLGEDDVIAFARERIANFKVPRQVEFIDALPRNLGGKVLKNELRDGAGVLPRESKEN
ncbi:FadD3 family acyl-CoA ligase [Nocardioides jensenii]|uniref:FadD3 family acyl-CoA ligase n=1 Tax=Nocardioides jensenii TaxID=1843 RepID=UPI0008367A30|nr:FadD3 family acyl-CoA ligase [Nocardioides jensenii]